jgi:hypothetical protein
MFKAFALAAVAAVVSARGGHYEDDYGYDSYGHDDYVDDYGHDDYGYDDYGHDDYGYDSYGEGAVPYSTSF